MSVVTIHLVPAGRLRGTVAHPVAWQQRRPAGSPVQTLPEEKQILEEVRPGPDPGAVLGGPGVVLGPSWGGPGAVLGWSWGSPEVVLV